MTVIAALSLLAMPVDYRGGAEFSHAHGLFQFWFPGGHTEIDFQDHHHGGKTRHAADSARTRHSSEHTSRSTVDRGSDVPVLSEMGDSAERASSIAIAMVLALLAFVV